VGREGDYGGMEKKFFFFCPLQFVYIRTMVYILYVWCKIKINTCENPIKN